MADFSAQSTTLAEPQGAGSAPLAPVQPAKQVSTTSGLFALGDIFAKGLDSYRKEEAERRNNAILSEYIQQENTISEGISQGSIKSAEAAARSRANFRKFSSGHPELILEFEKAGKALRGFTEAGQAVDREKTAAEVRASDINAAKQRGFIFVDGMTPEQENAQIYAAQAAVKAEKEWANYTSRTAEKRAAGTYSAAEDAREQKQLAVNTVNMVAGENLTAFQAYSQAIAGKMRRGELTDVQAKTELTNRFANISAALQAGAGASPELAAPYRSIFESVYKISNDMLDPKADIDSLQREFDTRVLQMKLVAMNDPKVAALIVANQLIPNNLQLQSSVEATRALAILSDIPFGKKNPDGSNTFVPQVVGNPDVEPKTLDALKTAFKDLATGKIKNKEIAEVQATNSVNHILKQAGDLINQGVSPQQLAGIASFVASPEYASFVTSGKLAPEAAVAAKRAFQLIYEPTIINGVQKALAKTVTGDTTFMGRERTVKKSEPMAVMDMVDVKFSGTGIIFEPKAKAGLNPAEYRAQVAEITNLQSSQKAITQLIHIAAHMEGRVDYAAVWKEKRHEFVPGYFMQGVDDGDVVNGYQKLPGPASSESSWKKVSNAGAK